MSLVYVYRVALGRFFFSTCMSGTVVIESQLGGRNAEYANNEISHTYITTSKQFNCLLRPYALNPGCSNFEFGLETRNSEDFHVSSVVFPKK